MEHAELIKRLEAERNDISYRVKNPKPLTLVKVKRVVSERDKKLYFNAGRYAAGDRDTLAAQANARLQKIEGAQV